MFIRLAALSLLASGCTSYGAAPAVTGGVRQTEAHVIMPLDPEQRTFQEDWGFAEAVVVGDTIYLSGIVVDKPAAGADLAAAYERTYRVIGAILARAGASWDDVVDITSFHTDVKAQIRPMVAAHKRFVKAPYPAWTAIGGTQILGDGITEIKIVAKRPARARKAQAAKRQEGLALVPTAGSRKFQGDREKPHEA